MVSFQKDTDPKTIPQADRRILQLGELTRPAIVAQDAGAAHKPWLGGKVGQSNSIWIPFNRKLSEEELKALTRHGEAAGLPNVVDTGQGVTMTKFGGDTDVAQPPPMSRKTQEGLLRNVSGVLPDAGLLRSSVDQIYQQPKWGAAWRCDETAAW